MPKTDTPYTKLLDDHRELRTAATSLRKFLSEPHPEHGAHTWADSLASKLVDFHDKVSQHFTEEESKGFLDELFEDKLWSRRILTLLLKEHDRILADLRSALQSAMIYAESKPTECPNLRQWTLSILDRFAQHEEKETDLMQRFLLEDLGGGG